MVDGSNRKWCRSIRRPQKTHPRTKHEGDRSVDVLLSYGHLKFSNMCEWALRSVVGRRSSIYTSYTDLIYSSFATLGTWHARSKKRKTEKGLDSARPAFSEYCSFLIFLFPVLHFQSTQQNSHRQR